MGRNRFVVPVVLVLAAAYGAGTQYLGARVPGWGPDAAQLSAPWLLIAFVAGSTQKDVRRAALLGFACTLAALVGYWVMTDSPIEGAHYTFALARGFFISNAEVVVGALVTGPLFGWLGQQWRTRRSIAGPLLVAAAFCFEPLARQVTINPIGFRSVWVAEVAAGLAGAAAILTARYGRRSRA